MSHKGILSDYIQDRAGGVQLPWSGSLLGMIQEHPSRWGGVRGVKGQIMRALLMREGVPGAIYITALAKKNSSDLDDAGAIVLMWSSQVHVILDGRAYPGLAKKLEERSQINHTIFGLSNMMNSDFVNWDNAGMRCQSERNEKSRVQF